MPTPGKSIRFPPALAALIEAEANASDRSFSDVVLDAVAAQLLGHAAEPMPAARAAPAATRAPKLADPAPKLNAAREALAGVEKRVSVASAVMANIPLGGGKRPAYQRGQAGRGGAKGGR